MVFIMSIVSLFRPAGRKLPPLGLLKIKASTNQFFAKRVTCLFLAIPFYIKRVGQFLSASLSVFKDPVRKFWQSRSMFLAISCGKEAFHRAFSQIPMVVFFPLVMIAGLFYPSIYQVIEDRMISSLPLSMREIFRSSSFEEDRPFYIEMMAKSAFLEDAWLKVFEKKTKEEFVDFPIHYLRTVKDNDVKIAVDLMMQEDIKFVKNILEVQDKSSFDLQTVVKILSKVSKNLVEEIKKFGSKEKVDVFLEFVQKSHPEELKDIEGKLAFYDRASLGLKEVLESLSAITEGQLQKIYSWKLGDEVNGFSKEKMNEILRFIQKSNGEDLDKALDFIERILKIYSRSTCTLDKVVKIFSKIKEPELQEVYSAINLLSNEKMDELLMFIQNRNPEDLENIREIAVIYEKSSLSLEDLWVALSKIKRAQREGFCGVIRYFRENKKVDEILKFIQNADTESLENIIDITKVYDTASFRLKDVLTILSKLDKTVLQKFTFVIHNFLSSQVDAFLEFVQKGHPEELKEKLKDIELKLEVCWWSSFDLKKVLEILSTVTEGQLRKIYKYILDGQIEMFKILGMVDMRRGQLQEVGLLSEGKLNEMLAFIYKDDGKSIDEKLKAYEGSSLGLERVWKILQTVTEDPLRKLIRFLSKEDPDELLAFIDKNGGENIAKKLAFYNRSSLGLKEVLESLSAITKGQLRKIYSWKLGGEVNNFSKEKMNEILRFIQKNDWEDLDKALECIERILKIYSRSTCNLDKLLKIFSKIKEPELQDICSTIGLLSNEKMHEILMFIQNGSQKDLENVRELVVIYEKSSLTLEDVLAVLSKIKRAQRKGFCEAIRDFQETKKVDEVLKFIQNADKENLENIIDTTMVYNKSSFKLKDVVTILSKLNKTALRQITSVTNLFLKEQVDELLAFIGKRNLEDIKNLMEMVPIYSKSSFGLKDVLTILSKLDKTEYRSFSLGMHFLSEETVDEFLRFMQNASVRSLKKIKEILWLYKTSSFSLEALLAILSKMTINQLDFMYSEMQFSTNEEIEHVLTFVQKSSIKFLDESMEAIVIIYKRASFSLDKIANILSGVTEDQANQIATDVKINGLSFQDALVKCFLKKQTNAEKKRFFS